MYLDNSATTKISDEVLEEMLPYLKDEFGNPSTLYSIGRESKKALEEARQRIADSINAKKDEIIFTSGGSESDNLAIKGIAFKLRKKGKHIITSEIEHPAVKESLYFLESLDFKVTYLPVYENGIIKKGVIVRHLLLPKNIEESKKIIKYLYDTYKDDIFISIMNQYTPMPQVADHSILKNKVTQKEYDDLVDYAVDIGVENGFIQEGETAEESFIPPFNCEGV